jgi:hypothetical protein
VVLDDLVNLQRDVVIVELSRAPLAKLFGETSVITRGVELSVLDGCGGRTQHGVIIGA